MSDNQRKSTSLFQRLTDFIFGYDFFISYSWSDGRSYAVELFRILEEQGFTCFLDSANYAKSDNWRTAGRRALKKTSRLILVGTPNSIHSEPVLAELRIFSESGRRIFPIDIANGLSKSDREEKAFSYLNPEILQIKETSEAMTEGPSLEAIDEIRKSFDLLRQDQKRIRWFSFLSALFAVISTIAILFGWYANQMKLEAIRKNKEALVNGAQAHWEVGKNYEEKGMPIHAGFSYLQASSAYQIAGEGTLSRNSSIAAQFACESLVASFPSIDPKRGAILSSNELGMLTWGSDGISFHDATEALTLRHWPTERQVVGAIFNDDNLHFLSWDEGGVAKYWDIRQTAPLQIWSHGESIIGAEISSNGVITWSNSGITKAWELTKTEPIQTWNCGSSVKSIQKSSDESRIASIGENGIIKLLDVNYPEPLFSCEHNKIIKVTFSPDNSLLLSHSRDALKLWGHPNWRTVTELGT